MNQRKPEYPVHELFLNRWSPRALSPEPIKHEDLMTLFEAAKWAPSSYNNQPWRFIYTHHNTPAFNQLITTMSTYNQTWADNASVLVLVVSLKTFEKNEKPSPSHSFDTGAACQNMALQASLNGLYLHLIEGFNKEQARSHMAIPDSYAIEVIAAIGKPADLSNLPSHLHEREKHSDRKKLSELVFKDTFT